MLPQRSAASLAAEISLVHLEKCLVNLPSSLVSLLINANTPAQNVVVQLDYRPPVYHESPSPAASSAAQKSIYVGWTGMPSKRKLAPIVGREGINGSRGASGRDQEISVVEIDAKFAATLGLQDGQKVVAALHLDPPAAHTVNIEPLTPEDWEMIELHAAFLELNMLNQIRAVPNPVFTTASGITPGPHPLTLHLSPTCTAAVKIISFEPALPAHQPFAKIAPDAEVIVAPKTRSKPTRSNKDSKSIGGTSKRSVRSSASTGRRKVREEKKSSVCLRGVDRQHCSERFGTDAIADEVCIWIDGDLLSSKDFKGVTWVVVSVIRPAGLQPPNDAQRQAQNVDMTVVPSTKIVARLRAWEEPPNGQTAAMSSALCAALGCAGMVGGVVKIEAAPVSLPRKTVPDADGRVRDSIQRLKIYPFLSSTAKQTDGLRFGGESRAERDEAANSIKQMYGLGQKGLLAGPLTDGQVLGVFEGLEHPRGWHGGVVKFDPAPDPNAKIGGTHWIMGSDLKLPLEVQQGVPIPPAWLHGADFPQVTFPGEHLLVGLDGVLESLKSHVSRMSSVLLTGGQGAGKTSVAQSIARTLREDQLYHTTYFPCLKLVNDESRISTIKETLTRLFMAASWGSRLGGKALVILDDLDRLCPAETELQVGNENGRSRQISETISAIARQFTGRDTNVVLLATSQSKDSLHAVVMGGHVMREITELVAPAKDARRQMMEAITLQNAIAAEEPDTDANGSRPVTADGSAAEPDNDWMDIGSEAGPSRKSHHTAGFVIDPSLDFLDMAGQTDGYMPGDIKLLVARARNEALIRLVGDMVADERSKSVDDKVHLTREDFDAAFRGFTPASLRNVTLQASTIKFDSIGGLKETRQVLLETLQYPTKYAPIFAQCPLRLRSGLLLYGYPGCGKTLLASAVAGECGLNFISVKGPEILNKYIGASEKSVRDLFERAQAAKPCVLFFDEFDSIAPKRGHDSTGVTDRVVNQLLTQMDGAEGLSGVYVLAATSRPDLIDPALLRPGRLDKSLLCDFPSLDDRLDIIKALAKKVRLDDEVLMSEDDLMELGRRTDGFSGADLQALMSNAQLEAIHDVLHDRDTDGSTVNGAARRAVAGRKHAPDSRLLRKNFVEFLYGGGQDDEVAVQPEGDLSEKPGLPRASALTDHATIVAKLESIKFARKRAKQQQQQHGQAATATSRPLVDPDGGDHQQQQQQSGEVVIGWRHIAKALEDTRASISAEERRRLERIYREFIVGRSGEMRDGQGSMEIGGRSSLM